jgi:hypothetical protein
MKRGGSALDMQIEKLEQTKRYDSIIIFRNPILLSIPKIIGWHV